MCLSTYQDRFARLVVNVRERRRSPHKICMLLAVLDLARSGALVENRILFSPALLERYSMFFAAVRGPGDHANAYFPFFHLGCALRGGQDSFWHLRPLPGREQSLSALSTARSVADITDNVSHAELDAELFALLQSPAAIDVLSEALARRWFDRGLQDLHAVVGRCGEVSRYERQPEAMVEAAHIVPFSESRDDDPRHGIALTPNMHWAMDRNLIAPGPDFLWHVSRALDDRIPDFRVFAELEGRRLFKPGEPRRIPRQDALIWRLDRLRDPSWRAQ